MGLLGRIISSFSKGPAIQNLTNFDMVIQMKDGGILLPIVCSKHLDQSDEVFQLFKEKVTNYVAMTELDEFKIDFPRRDYILIEANCVKKPDNRILNEIQTLNKELESKGIKITWKS
jgi:hypothetical protein